MHRTFSNGLFNGLLLLLLLGDACLSMEESRPNFVWLVSEDNSKHFLKLFDQHGTATPHIESLAEQGIIFERAFSNSPVCSVARSTLISGCYAPRIGAQFHRRSKMAPLPRGLNMFPAYLRDAGYYTTNNSKTDYNIQGGRAAWDESSKNATWRNRKTNQSFFHMQSFSLSHEGSLHFPVSDVAGKSTDTNPQTVFIPPHHPDTPLLRYTYARYHDQITKMDKRIGAVLDQLRGDGLLDDTFIFYFADHGGVLPGSKGYVYETGLHVPMVVRVPEKWQQIGESAMPGRSQQFVSFVDFGPTLLNLAGIDVPSQMDGVPFLGPGTSPLDRRDTTFGYADRFDEKIDFVRSVRQGRYKYIRNFQPYNFDGLQNNYRYRMAAYVQWREMYRAAELATAEQRLFFQRRDCEALYDLHSDPYETNNLARRPAYQKMRVALREVLSEHLGELPDLSFYPESFLLESAYQNPVDFGREHKAEIGALMAISDLALEDFAAAKSRIKKALASTVPWQRYWGLIVCSCFGDEAEEFVGQAVKILDRDPDNRVQARAAEFLGLVQKLEPEQLVQLIHETDSAVEANELLNTLVMLRDGPTGLDFTLDPAKMQPSLLKHRNIARRIEYLSREH